VGTRNCLVILAVSSRVNPFVKALAERLGEGGVSGGLDGIVAVSHSEGGSETSPRNTELLLRTLAGWICHPNVGALLAVDAGNEPVSNRRLQEYLQRSGGLERFGLEDLRPAFLSTGGAFERPMVEAVATASGWMATLRRARRSTCPASELTIALQCGGSDSFSGISANPLVAAVAARVIRQGGSANLAETPELAGAEDYVLAGVRDRETAAEFLNAVDRFRRWMAEHGHDPEGNPSAGNRRRGLYNITLKALGAAMKKPASIRLEEVVDYAEPPRRRGFYFMNSPGNDLESVAGQVASGCNLILFTTGSGSVTNFPFVPTLKVMSTSARFQLLRHDMDLDAGRVLGGEDLDRLTDEAYRLALEVASGRRTRGEVAGHAQVSIWRDWTRGNPALREQPEVGRQAPGPRSRESGDGSLEAFRDVQSAQPGGPTSREAGVTLVGPKAATADGSLPAGQRRLDPVPTGGGSGSIRRLQTSVSRYPASGPPSPIFPPPAHLRCDLIVPTSLCAGQVAVAAVRRLAGKGGSGNSRRLVALPHTEGCGCTGGTSQELFERLLLGHLTHPLVIRALLLEHGCEKVHNQRMQRLLESRGLVPEHFGWASVQLDGGFEAVLERIAAWYVQTSVAERATLPGPLDDSSGVAGVAPAIGLGWTGPVPEAAQRMLGQVASVLADEGWAVLESAPDRFSDRTAAGEVPHSLEPWGFAQPPPGPGRFRMETVTAHWGEILTGLAAAGCLAVIAWHGDGPRPGHPLVPVLRVGPDGSSPEFDVTFPAGEPRAADLGTQVVLEAVGRCWRGRQTVRAWRLGDVDFQVPRGPWGISV
jgi:altronate dehydratase